MQIYVSPKILQRDHPKTLSCIIFPVTYLPSKYNFDLETCNVSLTKSNRTLNYPQLKNSFMYS